LHLTPMLGNELDIWYIINHLVLIILSTYDTKGFLLLDAQDYDMIQCDMHLLFLYAKNEGVTFTDSISWIGLGFARKQPHPWKQTFLKWPIGLLLTLACLLHLFTFSTIYGSSLWVTFVLRRILSKNISC
jgi:cell division protein FtsW (lipid II flippase)